MVGRLVQNEDLAGVGKNARHGDALAFPAGQRPHFFVKIRDAQLVQHGFARIVPLGGRFRRQIADCLLQHGLFRIADRSLRQIADADAAGENDLAGICVLHARRDPQQGGFSGAVDADQADLVTLVDGVGKMRQQGGYGIGFGDIGCVQ